MKIEKTMETNREGKPARSFFFFFKPSNMGFFVLLFATLIVSEAYYRFRLYPDQGLENCLGPAGFSAITLLAVKLLMTRSDRQSRSARWKRRGVSTIQRVVVDDTGIKLCVGSLMRVSYTWQALEDVKADRKHLLFYISGKDQLCVKRSPFSQEELDRIISFWKTKEWLNKGFNSPDPKPIPPPIPKA
ncbi:MAG: YcxB family protein [Lentisphaeria bacterium]|nr:YcxB family protein [Lentisphaeria bacterium]